MTWGRFQPAGPKPDRALQAIVSISNHCRRLKSRFATIFAWSCRAWQISRSVGSLNSPWRLGRSKLAGSHTVQLVRRIRLKLFLDFFRTERRRLALPRAREFRRFDLASRFDGENAFLGQRRNTIRIAAMRCLIVAAETL
jgi:hypothetical protein